MSHLRIMVPDNSTARATIELDGKPLRCDHVEIELLPMELPRVAVSILPELIDMDIDCDPDMAILDKNQDLHQYSVRSHQLRKMAEKREAGYDPYNSAP